MVCMLTNGIPKCICGNFAVCSVRNWPRYQVCNHNNILRHWRFDANFISKSQWVFSPCDVLDRQIRLKAILPLDQSPHIFGQSNTWASNIWDRLASEHRPATFSKTQSCDRYHNCIEIWRRFPNKSGRDTVIWCGRSWFLVKNLDCWNVIWTSHLVEILDKTVIYKECCGAVFVAVSIFPDSSIPRIVCRTYIYSDLWVFVCLSEFLLLEWSQF